MLGTIGSGKTTVSDYLVSKGFERVIMGDLVREKTKQEGLKLTRENLQAIQKKYRDKYGQEYFIKEVIKKLKESGKDKLLIDGVRVPMDAILPKKDGAVLILVDAPKKIRFERLKARGRENDPQTMQEFIKQEKAEWKAFNFKETLKYVDYEIDNSGNLRELYRKVDELLKKDI